MALECKLEKVNEDGNIIGEIVNVSVDESILDAEGTVDLSNGARLPLIRFTIPIRHWEKQ